MEEPTKLKLLTVAEAADLLRLKESTVRAWILRRQIPYIKMGGKRVFLRRSDLEQLIATSVVPAQTGKLLKNAA
jgi:excisionase family DNA binding protein